MTRASRIKQRLDVLKPQYIEIIDDTPKHAGHLENSEQLETHLTLIIFAQVLTEMPLVKQHKTINDHLADEFENGLHALSIKVLKTL
jgi:BolA protein